MTKLLAVSLLSSLVVSCIAVVTDPDETVANFTLQVEPSGALLARECVSRHGVAGCTPYPNALECDQMKVAVKADGRTHIECTAGGRLVHFGFAQSPTVPFLCKPSSDLSCQVCVDLFGNTVHDTCNRNAQAFRQTGSGWSSVPEGSAFLEDDGAAPPEGAGPPLPPPAPPTATSACDPANAILMYAAELNKVLSNEGLNFNWVPNVSQFPDPAASFLAAGKSTSCEAFLANLSDLDECWIGGGASCHYCTAGDPKVCKCYRINVVAMKAVCKAIPHDCKNEKKLWSANLIMAYGAATKWLFSPTYGSFYGKIPAAAMTLPASVSQTQVVGGGVAKFPTCKGSPLVLDLAGDGINPTSAAAGVSFDLYGLGPQRTAWVRGDDALLVLDRNGNGLIDGGGELFGEATAGRPHADGFEALRPLDENRDGRLDRHDRSFGGLRLWSDANGDGVSQPEELATLAAKGIRSLELSATRSESTDRHGNDLGLRSSFTRADGRRGLLVDVYFVDR